MPGDTPQSSAARVVLEALEAATEPPTSAQLAEVTGLAPSVVRHHLRRMRDAGTVVEVDHGVETGMRGRPARAWRARPAVDVYAVASIAAELARAQGAAIEDPATTAAIRELGRQLAMASDGDAFNFVWEDGMFEEETNTLAFARAAGTRVETRRTALTNGRAVDMQPAAAVAPDGNTGVTWTHADPRSGRPTVVFARVGKNGRTVGELLTMPRAGADALFSSVAWGGREYLVAWTEVRGENVTIALGRVSPDGRRPQ